MNPVLFVHGIIGDIRHYQPTIKYLRKKGFEKFYEFSYKNKYGNTPIKVAAEELAEYIKNNVTEKNINIVAISQGGIVALAYLKYFKNINVDKLFTLCSPHKGTRLATTKIVTMPGLVDLCPNSQLLKELEVFVRDAKINLYSIYTPFDLVVYPGWRAKSKYGKNKIIFAPGHSASLSWRPAMKFIYKNLL